MKINTRSESIYRELILEHWRDPQNFGTLAHPTHEAFLNNPLCGDEISVQLIEKNGKIEDIRFEGRGCAISIAATSLLTEELKGKSIAQIRNIDQKTIIDLLGVEPSPTRMKCAMLGLETVKKAQGGTQYVHPRGGHRV